MGYKFQFITLAGFHTQNIAIFELAEKYKTEGMSAYSKIQELEFAREKDGYTSVKHQREVGTTYFDAVSNTISSGKSSTTAMEGSQSQNSFKLTSIIVVIKKQDPLKRVLFFICHVRHYMRLINIRNVNNKHSKLYKSTING